MIYVVVYEKFLTTVQREKIAFKWRSAFPGLILHLLEKHGTLLKARSVFKN